MGLLGFVRPVSCCLEGSEGWKAFHWSDHEHFISLNILRRKEGKAASRGHFVKQHAGDGHTYCSWLMLLGMIEQASYAPANEIVVLSDVVHSTQCLSPSFSINVGCLLATLDSCTCPNCLCHFDIALHLVFGCLNRVVCFGFKGTCLSVQPFSCRSLFFPVAVRWLTSQCFVWSLWWTTLRHWEAGHCSWSWLRPPFQCQGFALHNLLAMSSTETAASSDQHRVIVCKP